MLGRFSLPTWGRPSSACPSGHGLSICWCWRHMIRQGFPLHGSGSAIQFMEKILEYSIGQPWPIIAVVSHNMSQPFSEYCGLEHAPSQLCSINLCLLDASGCGRSRGQCQCAEATSATTALRKLAKTFRQSWQTLAIPFQASLLVALLDWCGIVMYCWT